MTSIFDDLLQFQRGASRSQFDSNSSEQLSPTTTASTTTATSGISAQPGAQDAAAAAVPARPTAGPAEAAGMAEAGAPAVAGEAQNFIVFLDNAPGAGGLEQRMRALMGGLGVAGEPVMVFDQLNGFVLNITEQQAQRLRGLGGVESVEADAAVFLEPPIPGSTSPSTVPQAQAASLTSYGNGPASSGETLPWGVRAVWQGDDISAQGNFASDTFAFVIDSGVLSTTGDLNLASTSSWHRSWIAGETAFTDGNGHGSHVAGTIAALANGKGVVGVAPGAQVVSLKVFDSSGGGASYSAIIDAINHAVAVTNNNGLDKSKVVINMSLGGGFSSSLDTAVKNAANQGIRLAVAAGNSGDDADKYSPAAAGDHPNVYTISAVDSNYRMASWSNWDRLESGRRGDSVDDVDFAAPGVSVLSYYQNGQLAYLSGTSMAAPHVAGLLLAGGVQAGSLVTPYYSGTADPFALGVSLTTDPEDPGTDPEPPVGPTTPTYTITSSANSVDEGKILVIDIATTDVSEGTALYWRISGNGISTSDFVGLSSLEGSVSTNAAGAAQLNLSIAADALTEGNELMTVTLFSDSGRTTNIGDVAVTIQDTSTTPVTSTDQMLWGTTGSDVITGGDGNDRISGVLASGTTAAAMGAGQVDVLTGGGGANVFVLGDERGVFYDDRNPRNTGDGDYALIKDFTQGVDQLQLAGGSYVFTTSGSNLFLYWDQNGNERLDTGGRDKDELIAVLEGVSSISASDIIWA